MRWAALRFGSLGGTSGTARASRGHYGLSSDRDSSPTGCWRPSGMTGFTSPIVRAASLPTSFSAMTSLPPAWPHGKRKRCTPLCGHSGDAPGPPRRRTRRKSAASAPCSRSGRTAINSSGLCLWRRRETTTLRVASTRINEKCLPGSLHPAGGADCDQPNGHTSCGSGMYRLSHSAAQRLTRSTYSANSAVFSFDVLSGILISLSPMTRIS